MNESISFLILLIVANEEYQRVLIFEKVYTLTVA